MKFSVQIILKMKLWKTGGNAKNKYQLNRFHDNLIVVVKVQSKHLIHNINHMMKNTKEK